MKRQKYLICWVILGTILILAGNAGAGMIDLGALGGTVSGARAINDVGQVVGYAETPDGYNHAFLYSGGVMQDLGTLGGNHSVARSINNFGLIVGESKTTTKPLSPTHAFVYADGVMQDLGTLGNPKLNTSRAYGINDSGQIVGYSTYRSRICAFTYFNGVMTEVGTLPGGRQSIAYAVNSSGQIVGCATTAPGAVLPGFLLGNLFTEIPALLNGNLQVHAFLYDPMQGMKDLGTLGGSMSIARAINAQGQVVGLSTTADGKVHGFLYTDGEMQDLGTLAKDYSIAYDINDSGQIIGVSSTTEGGVHAFLYAGEVRKDLGTLGGKTSAGRGINAYGQIVGLSYTADGKGHAFMDTTPLDAGTQ